METRYANTLISTRGDKKLAFSDNIFDKKQAKLQEDINVQVKNDLEDVKAIANDNLTKAIADLKNLIDAKVIEAGGVVWDTQPTEGNYSNTLSSDALYKEFLATRNYSDSQITELSEALTPKVAALEASHVYLTDAEYDALVAAGEVDENVEYLIYEE
jgi:hypothetical protein